jgi:hypothetical protein
VAPAEGPIRGAMTGPTHHKRRSIGAVGSYDSRGQWISISP